MVLNVLLPLATYAFLGYQLSRLPWTKWMSMAAHYLLVRPYLPEKVNLVINVICSVIFSYAIIKGVYNRYFHPLAHFPGPFLASITYLPWSRATFKGQQSQQIHKWHKKYGPAVRVAPNEISFISEQALQDLFTKRGDRYPYPKDPNFYRKSRNGSWALPMVPSPEHHSRMRKQIVYAFSDRALTEQEPIIRNQADIFIRVIEEDAANRGEGDENCTNLAKWFSYAIFDSIGEFALGESFHTMIEETNRHFIPLLESFTRNIQKIIAILKIGPWLRPMLTAFIPKSVLQQSDNLWNNCVDRIHRRIDRGAERKDLLSYITTYEADGETKKMTMGEIEANGMMFIFAGAETTAGALTAAVAFLIQEPGKLKKLSDEIRNAFNDPKDINMKSLAPLPYLNAVLYETLRKAPPFTGSSKRVADEDCVISGHRIPKGVDVSFIQYAAHHSPAHFRYATSFIPERWLPADSPSMKSDPTDPYFNNTTFQSDCKDAMLPFSVGPRNCVGLALAWVEMRLFLALLVFHYDLERPSKKEDHVVWEEQENYAVWVRKPLKVKLTRAR